MMTLIEYVNKQIEALEEYFCNTDTADSENEVWFRAKGELDAFREILVLLEDDKNT